VHGDGLGDTYVELDRQTFGTYLDQQLDGKVKLKDGTRLSYETHIRLYLKPGLGHLELAAPPDRDFEELYGAMRLIGPFPAGRRLSPLLRDLTRATPHWATAPGHREHLSLPGRGLAATRTVGVSPWLADALAEQSR